MARQQPAARERSRSKRDEQETDSGTGTNGNNDEVESYEKELAGYLQERIKPGLNRGSIPLLARSIAKEIAHRERPNGASEDVEAEAEQSAEAEDEPNAKADSELTESDEQAEADEEFSAEADEDEQAEADEDFSAEADEDEQAEADEDFSAEADEDEQAEADEEFSAEADEDEQPRQTRSSAPKPTRTSPRQARNRSRKAARTAPTETTSARRRWPPSRTRCTSSRQTSAKTGSCASPSRARMSGSLRKRTMEANAWRPRPPTYFARRSSCSTKPAAGPLRRSAHRGAFPRGTSAAARPSPVHRLA